MFDIIIPLANFDPGSMKHRFMSMEAVLPVYTTCPDVNKVFLIVQDLDENTLYIPNTISGLLKVEIVSVRYPHFSKGWLYNIGAMKSESEYLCFTETDMCPPDTNYFERVLYWMNDYRLSFALGWQKLLYSTEHAAQIIIDQIQYGVQGCINDSVFYGDWREYGNRGTTGGYLFCRRKKFFEIGMYNETFFGLGGIDNEIWERLTKTSGIYAYAPETVYHLYHPRILSKHRIPRHLQPNSSKLKQTIKKPFAANAWCREYCEGNEKEPCQIDFPWKLPG